MRLFLFATLLGGNLFGGSIQRCQAYVHDVRVAHYEQFGVDYPYQDGVGQLVQESGCRNVLSYDGVGSEGLPQITYRLWQKPLSDHGVKSIKAIPDQLKAQAIIMKSVYDKKYGLWVTYQTYNGGGLVSKEIARAGVENWEKAKANCRRGQSCFTYPSGKKECVSNCEINYDYSVKVWKYGQQYSLYKSVKWRYW
ncbi:hypothetical protein [Sulfuricurvum sp.]|uniref:hypothetical protein n=1 Tax=Sulfuricurvum sp. TaxID=2025608 RepID=UPI002619402A|nr:hypothetical protein [Sulfuricurvum sp.]MDD2267460.1 hypothetical protein [Sulfuricurvum sp.]MDD2782818.1 hypothetical protein [Sulfuricurvum sp.]